MPFGTVKLQPSVKTELTPTLNEAGISASNLIRFQNGLPQKLGGWNTYYSGSLVTNMPRALCAWEDLNANYHLGVATDANVAVITSGIAQDVSPQSTTTNNAVSFSTTATSNVVSITDTSSNTTIYDVIILNTPVSVGGLVLYGPYSINTVTNANQYTILAAANATSTVTNGGAVPQFTTTNGSSTVSVTLANHGYSVGSTFPVALTVTIGGLTLYGFYTVSSVSSSSVFAFNAANQATSSTSAYINGGNAQIVYWITPVQSSPAIGYGQGGYGQGGYGTGYVASTHYGTPVADSTYSLANWGKTLITNPSGYGVFAWSPDSGLRGSQLIVNAPTAATGLFIAMPEQQIVVYGASTYGINDPMLVAWCDNGNYNTWTAAVSNQAGTFRLTRGSKIVGGLQGPQQALLWTDLGCWAMQYVGYPLVYGFNEIAQGCGLIAKDAVGVLGPVVYWMSQKGFFMYANGAVSQLPCDVWDVIFQNLNTNYAYKIKAAPNSQFGEIAWHFTSKAGGGVENDTYVKFNPSTNSWDYGSLNRSCWIDQSVLGSPLAGTYVGGTYYVVQHEMTNDANGVAMTPSFQTGYFMLSDGEEKVFIDYMIPDFKYQFYGTSTGASVQVTLYSVNFPGDTPTQYGPYTVTNTSTSINLRARGRYFAMKFSSSDLGTWWRIGGVKFRFAQDGRN